MRYSRRISNHPKRITLSDLTYVMSMDDHVGLNVETPMIESGCYLEKEFTELIHMNY